MHTFLAFGNILCCYDQVAEVIVEACRDWRPAPTLVSLAPLTNIALALALEPRLPSLCPELYIMGGTVLEPGNTSPVSEANLANDAEAARRVFDAGFNLYVASLDVTMATWLDTPYLESIRSLPGKVGPFVWNITRFYTRAYHEHAAQLDGMPLHDPSAMLLLLRPSLYALQRWPATIDVATYPSAARGMVIADRRGGPLTPPPPPNVTTHFAMKVDVGGVRKFLRRGLAAVPAATAHAVRIV